MCDTSRERVESGIHVFRDCKMAESVWQELLDTSIWEHTRYKGEFLLWAVEVHKILDDRDLETFLVGCWSLWDSDHIESVGAIAAVELAKKLRVSNLHLEGDSLAVINTINSIAEDFSSYGAIIEDIKSHLGAFNNLICSYTPRVVGGAPADTTANNCFKLLIQSMLMRMFALGPFCGSWITIMLVWLSAPLQTNSRYSRNGTCESTEGVRVVTMPQMLIRRLTGAYDSVASNPSGL
ncbi:hypothetical protein U1Q18_010832 [Sarracenia purpurea var. burkii]